VCFGHLGDGNLHYNLFPAQAVASPTELEQGDGEQLSRIVLDLVAEMGGSFSAEHGVGQFKVLELARYRDPIEINLMRQLKAAWDPHHLMNPGKLFE
jgi:FAD/FMN-containing dehydrogenase